MKTLQILEVMWFTISLFAFLIGTYEVITQSLSESIGFFIIAVLSLAFGFFRRNQRIRNL